MKKKLYKFFCAFLIIIAIFSTHKYILSKINHYKIQVTFNKISALNKEINLSELKEIKTIYQNEDIVGYLQILNEDFIEPLVQTDNNDYYLNHLIDKSSSILGSTFVDYRVNSKSNQINIYSHSSSTYDLPFNILSNYLEEEYYKSHKKLILNYKDNIELYEIFSIYVTSDDFEYLNPNNSKEHVINIKEKSMYKENINIKDQEKLLILQTCLNGNTNGVYLIICGRKI